jgi:hypothetical protein
MKKIQINSNNNLTFSIKKNRIKTNPNTKKKSGFDYDYVQNNTFTRDSFNKILSQIPNASGTLIITNGEISRYTIQTLKILNSSESLRDLLRQKGIDFLKNLLTTHSLSKIQIHLAYAD